MIVYENVACILYFWMIILFRNNMIASLNHFWFMKWSSVQICCLSRVVRRVFWQMISWPRSHRLGPRIIDKVKQVIFLWPISNRILCFTIHVLRIFLQHWITFVIQLIDRLLLYLVRDQKKIVLFTNCRQTAFQQFIGTLLYLSI